MCVREHILLLEFKARLYEKFQLYKDDDLLKINITNLLECLEKFLHIKDAHITVYKDVLGDNEQIIISYTLESLSYFEEWQKKRFFIEEIDQPLVNLAIPNSSFNKMLLLRNSKGLLKGAVLLEVPENSKELSMEFWAKLSKIIYDYLKRAIRTSVNIRDKKKFKNLYTFTNQFHSFMNIDSILREMLHSLKEIYPALDYVVMLSNDTVQVSDLPVEPIDFTKNDSAAMEAFVTGTYRIEDDLEKRATILYFPLKGKQGIYGVVKICANQSIMISEQDVEFMDILAQTAANAIENAHLFQQSEQLVADLRLVTEFSKELNSFTSLNDIIEYAVGKIKDYFRAEEVGFVLYEAEEIKVLPGSSTYFLDRTNDLLLLHIRNKLNEGQESVFAGNFSGQTKDGTVPFKSLMVEPLKKGGENIGFSVAAGEKPYAFSFNAFKIFQSLTHHAALALSNALLLEELEKMVITDYLTKLYTRKYLDDQMKLSMEKDDGGAFILIDIDDFKFVNDSYGHQVGDDVLIQIANQIKKLLKKGEIASRWGGEEIAIYCPDYTLEEGIQLARVIKEWTKKYTSPAVTLSIGVASWNKYFNDNPFALFKRADEALYYAKEHGKNQVYGIDYNGIFIN